MKKLLPLIAAILVTGCAGTTVRDRNGKTRFHTQADVKHLDYKSSDGDMLVMDAVDHSTPTKAGGTAFSRGVAAMGTAISNVAVGLGNSGWVTAIFHP